MNDQESKWKRILNAVQIDCEVLLLSVPVCWFSPLAPPTQQQIRFSRSNLMPLFLDDWKSYRWVDHHGKDIAYHQSRRNSCFEGVTRRVVVHLYPHSFLRRPIVLLWLACHGSHTALYPWVNIFWQKRPSPLSYWWALFWSEGKFVLSNVG